MIRKRMWIVVVGVLLGVAFGATTARTHDHPQPATSAERPSTNARLPGGPFTLVDHTGRAVADRDFRGKFMLVFFGYTFCPDVCPTDLNSIGEAMDLLKEDGVRIQPIFISLDPERDSINVMADYVGNFHPRLVGLTGTPQQVKIAATAYRVGYYKTYPAPSSDGGEKAHARTNAETASGDYHIAHSAVTYLMGPDGRFLRVFDHETDASKMADAIRAYLKDASS